MIQSKHDLYAYLEADKIALNYMHKKKPHLIHDIIWIYQIYLRKCEYYENSRKDLLGKVIGKIYKLRFIRLSRRLGFSIGLNVFGKGLSIAHYGTIVVSNHAIIGNNCRIHEGVTIGVSGDAYWGEQTQLAPIIGNNVFIGTGAKIIGSIKIADNVSIGANAVVTKDILECNTTWAGVPAKKVSNNGSDKYIRKDFTCIKN